MEINITSLLEADQFALSHSRMEGGENAGQNTWRASLEAAEETPLLDTEEKLQAMRDFALSSGGWDDEEVAAWTSQEVNALFLQWIAGDCRECGADRLGDLDWGTVEAGNLFKGIDGQIYFSIEP